MNRISRSLMALAVPAFLLAAGACSRHGVPAAGEDALSYMPDDHPTMQKAYAKARSGLAEFLELSRSPPPHLSGFALKVGLGAGDNTEYVWIGNFSELAAGEFTGLINNEVEIARDYKLGDQYSFRREDIVDWMYVDNERQKMFGNYTLCALLTQEDPAEAARLQADYKLDCSL
jgi:uncharacterized protein YegJ (DUF2314 family)